MRSGATRRSTPLPDNVWGRALGIAAKLAEVLLFVVAPAALTVWALRYYHGNHRLAYDFHYGIWPVGHRVLHGITPYEPGAWFRPDPTVGFVYPAPAALLFAPAALVSRDVGDALATAGAIAAPLITLRLLGVSDWRAYGFVFLWSPVLAGWQNANLSIFFVPLVAALWVLRSRQVLVGLLLGTLVAIKLLLWPFALFFLATRRYVAVGYAVGAAVVLNVVAWAVVGFDEVERYRAGVNRFRDLHEDNRLSVVGLVERLGAERPLAYAVVGVGAAALLAAAVIVGRRGDEPLSFELVLATSLMATPVMELHYLALLVVAVGLMRRELALVWALPLLLWVAGRVQDPAAWQVAATHAIVAATFAVAAITRSPPRSAPAAPPPAAR